MPVLIGISRKDYQLHTRLSICGLKAFAELTRFTSHGSIAFYAKPVVKERLSLDDNQQKAANN
ncbi:MAG TPA: hypothetical protein O0X39_00115 [Methanocorpusculum sp.]|nr:hypothetical protein [Methanocorpusculum sp.]